ncbi:MAG: hypothetical protein HQL07_13030 [Nitrospirae bacterium]|nr:hypothetical protein [Magnetococcales bacterium]
MADLNLNGVRVSAATWQKYCLGEYAVTEEENLNVPGDTPVERADYIYSVIRRNYGYQEAYNGGAAFQRKCPAMFAGPKPEPPPKPPLRPVEVHYDPPPPNVAIPEPAPVPKPPPETKQVYSSVLDVVKPGVQRVCLYCSDAVAKTATLNASGDCSVKFIGRRYELVTETIDFNRSTRGRLRYFYDLPEPTIEYKSQFWMTNGQEAGTPVFDRRTGTFISMNEITGSLVVSYKPGFSLYEVTYYMGRSLVTEAYFDKMRNAWLAGDINTVPIVPVRLYAFSKWHATQASFQRKVWPTGTSQLSYNKDSQFNEQQGTRISETVRVYSPTDPTVFVDVERDKFIKTTNNKTGETFSLRLF